VRFWSQSAIIIREKRISAVGAAREIFGPVGNPFHMPVIFYVQADEILEPVSNA